MKIFFYILSGFFALILCLLLSLWIWPSLVINNTSLAWFRSYVNQDSETLNWETANIQVGSRSFWTKTLNFQAENLSWSDTNTQTNMGNLSLESELEFSLFSFTRPRIEQLDLDLKALKLKTTELSLEGDLRAEKNQESVQAELDLIADLGGSKWRADFEIEGPIESALWNLLLRNEQKEIVVSTQGEASFEAKELKLTQELSLIWAEQDFLRLSGLDSQFSWADDFTLRMSGDWLLPGREILTQEVLDRSAKGSLELFFSSSELSLEEDWGGNLKVRGGLSDLHDFSEQRGLSKIFVPAPFHQLSGPIRFEISSTFSSEQKVVLPVEYTLETDLSSVDQALHLKLSGQLGVEQTDEGFELSSIEAELEIEDLKLVWPDLGLKAPPPLLPDDRFQKEVEAPIRDEPESPPFYEGIAYDIRIRNSEKPIRIQTQFSGEPLSFSVNLRLQSERGILGSLNVDPITLELFRREAELREAKIEFASRLEESKVEALLLVPFSEYRVFVRVRGSVSEPVLILESEPALERQEILAVLLFGQPLGDLDFEEGDSVASAEAALVDKSLTLGTMFLFASTPVESISYNPLTEKVQARFRLPGGVSLMLGSDTETLTDVGIIKRLGGGFRFRTLFSEMLAEDSEVQASAVLEWLLRY